ncbi:rhodanese-like domain-containing protein [Vagococcus humatus]|uniref:Sulfurtransferase n=1 Tax=Vagococcus humatus TaxID=1889241 RepID=A0A429Z7H3_9ENTE|nr:rhodanese-like domain-containing protein [Vagococcus humatus]RST89624.1 sulfurtransferase [Vagococcus humatus]
MKPLTVINIILLVILLGILGNEIYLRIMAKRAAKTIKEEEFKELMRKSQVIDVREKDAFDAGHILGARNLPYSMFKQTYESLRKDQSILLYDQKKTMAIRAANILRKHGYQNIYILKGGYNDWTGKTKKK